MCSSKTGPAFLIRRSGCTNGKSQVTAAMPKTPRPTPSTSHPRPINPTTSPVTPNAAPNIATRTPSARMSRQRAFERGSRYDDCGEDEQGVERAKELRDRRQYSPSLGELGEFLNAGERGEHERPQR